MNESYINDCPFQAVHRLSIRETTRFLQADLAKPVLSEVVSTSLSGQRSFYAVVGQLSWEEHDQHDQPAVGLITCFTTSHRLETYEVGICVQANQWLSMVTDGINHGE